MAVPDVIHSSNVQTLYHVVLRRILEHGRHRSPRGLATTDLGHVLLHLNSPRDALPLRPGLSRRIAAAEAIQLSAGLYAPHLLPQSFERFQESGGYYHGAYGRRVGPQLAMLVQRLSTDLDTRQAVLTIWDPPEDNLPGKKDYPCTVALGFRIEEGALCLRVLMRSNDAWLGLPYDLFQFTQLQLTIANLLGRVPGDYVHEVWSLHLYDVNVPAVDALLEDGPDALEPEPLPLGLGRLGDTVEGMRKRARTIAFQGLGTNIRYTQGEEWYRRVLVD